MICAYLFWEIVKESVLAYCRDEDTESDSLGQAIVDLSHSHTPLHSDESMDHRHTVCHS